MLLSFWQCFTSIPGRLHLKDETIQIPTLNFERAWHHPKEFDPGVLKNTFFHDAGVKTKTYRNNFCGH